MQQLSSHSSLAHSVTLLRISIGVIYIWFGSLKFIPGLSPAEALAGDTIHLLTFGLIPKALSISILALWETVIGVAMIFSLRKSLVFYLILIHMTCTFAPLFLLSDDSFNNPPFALSLVGQYIVKNIVIISALLVIRFFERAQIENKII